MQAAAHTPETPHIAKHVHISDITHTITVKYNMSHNNYINKASSINNHKEITATELL